jgi:hypothetical protein
LAIVIALRDVSFRQKELTERGTMALAAVYREDPYRISTTSGDSNRDEKRVRLRQQGAWT